MNKIKAYIANWMPADYFVAVLLLVFTTYNRLMPILLILTGLTLFLGTNNYKDALSRLRFSSPLFWFIIFYLMHVVGLSYSENMNFALNDLSIKLSFLTIPLVFIFVKTAMTRKQVIDLLIAGFILSCVIAYSYAIFRSIYNREDNHWAYFTESYLSFMMHRSYFAVYMALGTLLCVHRWFVSKRIVYALLLILFGATVLLTFSKSGILILIMGLFTTIIVLSLHYFSRVITAVASLSIVLIIVLVFLSSSTLQVRFRKMIESVTSVATVGNPEIESSASRVIMWSTSLKLIKEHPVFGVGTGDVSDVMDKKNLELGNTGVASKSLNAHNQYLNTMVQLGLLGIVPLIMIFTTIIRLAVKKNDFQLIVISAIFSVALLFESFLETQAGIMPVTLILTLFVLKQFESVRNNNILAV